MTGRGALLLAIGTLGCAPSLAPVAAPTIELEPCRIDGIDREVRCATYEVWEDRDAATGRRIPLNIVVLPARDPRPELGPVVWLHGGPGAGATVSAPAFATSWFNEHHDVLLVDQRGTGASNPLPCDVSRPDDTLQAFLEGGFDRIPEIERCRDQLSERADLSLYTTSIAADDLNEVRRALGYAAVNLFGGSYGTRAALVFMRRHPESVRTAILTGVSAMAFRNPLYHASEAQKALDTTLAECAADTACAAAFPDLERKFDELVARLDAEPARVTVVDAATDQEQEVVLTRAAFAEGLRVFMYYMPRARRVPLLLHRAWEGDYRPIAQVVIDSNRGIRGALALGMLLSVTCSEDVARIDNAEIEAITADSFLGDRRIRRQKAACAVWPQGRVPEGFGDPVTVDVPTLLLSGTLDAVTGPAWGAEAARHLTHSLHLVVPGAHGVGAVNAVLDPAHECTSAIQRAFLEAGSVEGLDVACVDAATLPPFALE